MSSRCAGKAWGKKILNKSYKLEERTTHPTPSALGSLTSTPTPAQDVRGNVMQSVCGAGVLRDTLSADGTQAKRPFQLTDLVWFFPLPTKTATCYTITTAPVAVWGYFPPQPLGLPGTLGHT